ncbi:MAG: DUF4364 family protein [Clostridia bacterium]|nr:DUF4364 family protein [Clostridia bacterium]
MPRQKKTQERLDFLRTDADISYFITYVMTLLPGPITYEALLDICLIDEAFGYFEFQVQFDRLVETGIIFKNAENDPPLYFATQTCYDNAEGVAMALPASVKDKAYAAVQRVVTRMKRNSDIQTTATLNEDGTYKVTLAVMSGEEALFKLEIMLENKKNADKAIDNFKKHAEYYYREYLNGLLEHPEEDE